MSIPELECSWCGTRQRDRSALAQHEAEHRREDNAPKRAGRPKGPCNEKEIAARRANARTDRARTRPRPIRRWKDGNLEALKNAYEGSAKLNDICADFFTSRGAIAVLARRHGWKMRAPRIQNKGQDDAPPTRSDD